jgi:hypothetical protein
MKNLPLFTPFTTGLSNSLHLRTTRARLLALFVFGALLSTAAFSANSIGSVRGFFFGKSSGATERVETNSGSLARDSVSLSSAVATDGTLNVARKSHSATVLSDGKVLIVGGENQNGFVTEAEIFDPSTGSFSFSGNLNIPRADHSATRLSDGRVLIAGGRGDLGSLNSTEIFDPTNGVFTAGPDLTHSRLGPSATLQSDGRVLLAGGDGAGTLETYNPDSNNFSLAGASFNSPRSFHSAALMLDGRILFVGGRDADGSELSTGEIFDPSLSAFTEIAGGLKVTRVRAHLRVLFDGKVQIIGGTDDGSLEIYDPQINAFGAYVHVAPEGDTCANLPGQVLASQTRAALFHNGQSDETFDRSSHTMSELGTQATVVGGSNSSGAALSSAPLFTSSAAAISTDKLDYAPGQTVYISGRGFQAFETVRIKVHEDPHTPLERGMDVVADADGNFVAEYVVQDYDLHMKFLVGARGLSSGRTAQTSFTDDVPPTISLTVLGTSVCEDFDTLASSSTSSTTPAGWTFSESGTAANTTYTAGTGSLATGDTYSFGSTGNSERAFGGLQSGALIPTIGAAFTDNTGDTITSLLITYTGEQWRLGALSRTDRLDFQYSTDATSLTTGTWVNADLLDFTAPVTSPTVGALDGNASANRTLISSTISGLSIANGATFWIRWTDLNATGSDDGLAVDDFCLTPQAEPDVSVAVSPSEVDEDGGTDLVYTFTRSNVSGGALTVNFSVGGDATFGTDYTQSGADTFTSSAGTVTFAAGDSTATVTIDPSPDTTVESDETVILTVVSGVGYNVGSPTSATGTITNDDHELSINATSSVTEGDSGQSNMTFTVTLSPAHTQTVMVNYSTANGSVNPALGGGACGGTTDYVSQSGTLTFDPDDTVKMIDVPICGDTRDEPDETFTVTLDTPTNATIASGQGTSTGTITDDDAMPTISISDVTLAEGDSGTTAFNFTVTLSNPSQGTITVDFQTQDDTATQPSDYTSNSGTVTFDPDDTQETITVMVNRDTMFEPNETFFVNLSNNSTNSTLPVDTKGTGTITNDDDQPTVQFASMSSAGAESASPVDLEVTLSNATYQTVTVNYAVTGGTATGGGTDYTLASGMLTFNPGDTSENISLTVNNDALDEDDETVVVDLSSPDNATLGAPASHTYTIQDNDAPPTVQFALSSSDGAESVTPVDLEVTLSAASGKIVTVNYVVSGSSTATGAGVDYTLASGMLTFNPDDTSENVSVAINDDSADENDETVIVNLSSSVNANLGSPSSHTYTIQDNDAPPSFSINDVTLAEGNSGTTSFTFTVTKTDATELTSMVDYQTMDGTATAPTDYTAKPVTTLTFAPSDTTKMVTVLINGDATYETNESFTVKLSNATNATISDDGGAGTINNDDAKPSFSINDVTLAEGNAGITNFIFTLTKAGPTALTATVNFATADGTTNPATGGVTCGAGIDYESKADTLTFGPSDTTMTVTIKVCGDATTEANETFFVNLSGETEATIGDAQGLGTITNDDGVTYNFQGFFAPIDNPPLVNTVKAGAAVPVKWRITNAGAPVSDPMSFVGLFSYLVNCGSTDGLETPVETTAPGDSSLKYLGDGYWQINWKTLGNYPKGSCRILELRLNDGTSHYANFKFK